MNWFIENKEWLFSGIGIALPIALIGWYFFSNKSSSKTSSLTLNSNNTQTNGNGSIINRGKMGDTHIIIHAPAASIDQAAARDADHRRTDFARAYFAPELARIVAQQISILGRIQVNFITASVGKYPLPGDQLTSFRPWQPILYPSAAQFGDLSEADTTLLIEFYDSLQEITEIINSWIENSVPLDVNVFNLLMQKTKNSLDIGRNAVQIFCPERQYSAIMPSGGTLIDRLQQAVSSVDFALSAHLARHGVS